MKLPPILEGESRARLTQGFVVGAILTMAVGFGFAGWQLQGRAEQRAEKQADAAVVAALTPICVARFREAAGAPAKLVALKAIDSWKQDAFVASGGWATFAGSKEPNSTVAEACAQALAAAK
jgi:hypothetical protein